MSERFKCFDCHQAFSSQGSLYKHQKIHTGERPFVCETCMKSFNQLANLQRHFMVHTGEKPFACKTCGKQFSQQSNVDKHQVTHSSKWRCSSRRRSGRWSFIYIRFSICRMSRDQAVLLQHMQKTVYATRQSAEARTRAHGRTSVRLSDLSQMLRTAGQYEEACLNA